MSLSEDWGGRSEPPERAGGCQPMPACGPPCDTLSLLSAATEAAPGCVGNMADTPRDAGLKQAPGPRTEKAPVDFGYVGIDSILEQMRRKAMKQGFEFNIMVVGESRGSGSSSLERGRQDDRGPCCVCTRACLEGPSSGQLCPSPRSPRQPGALSVR